MSRALTRLALAAALPAVLTVAPAHAVTRVVPGCYGTGDFVFCDVTVAVEAPEVVETYQYTAHVCAGSCTDVPVTLVRAGDRAGRVCVGWWNEAGTTATEACVPLDVDVPEEIFESKAGLDATLAGIAERSLVQIVS